jgi:hypothetical protein
MAKVRCIGDCGWDPKRDQFVCPACGQLCCFCFGGDTDMRCNACWCEDGWGSIPFEPWPGDQLELPFWGDWRLARDADAKQPRELVESVGES